MSGILQVQQSKLGGILFIIIKERGTDNPYIKEAGPSLFVEFVIIISWIIFGLIDWTTSNLINSALSVWG